MLNQKSINATISTLGFELELSDKAVKFNTSNPHAIKLFAQNIADDFKAELAENTEATQALAELNQLIIEHENSTANISKQDLKDVYEMLKERQLHPTGEFDKMGRFYLEDYELVDVRSPSAKYPYSQMNAGRTSKFIKAMAEKYKVQSKDELIALFKKA